MRYEEDYRFCVTAALQIMQQQRKKLYQDCVEYEPTIKICSASLFSILFYRVDQSALGEHD